MVHYTVKRTGREARGEREKAEERLREARQQITSEQRREIQGIEDSYARSLGRKAPDKAPGEGFQRPTFDADRRWWISQSTGNPPELKIFDEDIGDWRYASQYLAGKRRN